MLISFFWVSSICLHEIAFHLPKSNTKLSTKEKNKKNDIEYESIKRITDRCEVLTLANNWKYFLRLVNCWNTFEIHSSVPWIRMLRWELNLNIFAPIRGKEIIIGSRKTAAITTVSQPASQPTSTRSEHKTAFEIANLWCG